MVRNLLNVPTEAENVAQMTEPDINAKPETWQDFILNTIYYQGRRFVFRNYDTFSKIVSENGSFDKEFFETLVLYLSMLVGFLFMFVVAYAGLALHCGDDKEVNLLNVPYSFCECTAKYHVNVNDQCVCKDENAFLLADKTCFCTDQSKEISDVHGYCTCKKLNYL